MNMPPTSRSDKTRKTGLAIGVGAVCGLLLLSQAPAAPAPKTQNKADPKAFSGLAVDFDKSTYAAKKFPSYTSIYAVFRNEKKKRPLFACGRGAGGAFLIPFDVSGLNDKEEPEPGTGETKVDLVFSDKKGILCFFRAEDWNDYACGQWVQADPAPTVNIVLSNLTDWKAKNKLMSKMLNPDRKRPPAGSPPEIAMFSTKIDMTLHAGNSRAEIKEVPCDIKVSDEDRYWQMRFVIKTTFSGADLGLVGADAGTISLFLVVQAFSIPPKGHGTAPPDLDLKSGAPLGNFE